MLIHNDKIFNDGDNEITVFDMKGNVLSLIQTDIVKYIVSIDGGVLYANQVNSNTELLILKDNKTIVTFVKHVEKITCIKSIVSLAGGNVVISSHTEFHIYKSTGQLLVQNHKIYIGSLIALRNGDFAVCSDKYIYVFSPEGKLSKKMKTRFKYALGQIIELMDGRFACNIEETLFIIGDQGVMRVGLQTVNDRCLELFDGTIAVVTVDGLDVYSIQDELDIVTHILMPNVRYMFQLNDSRLLLISNI